MATRPGGIGLRCLGSPWEALFGLVLLVPVAGSSYRPNLGGLFGAIDRGGIDEGVRDRIRDLLGPPTSALGMFLRDARPELVTGVIHAYGGTAAEASLSLEPDSELAQELERSRRQPV